MTDHDDTPWLNVLAGKAQPSDHATRQAAALRQYFERQVADDLAQVPDLQEEKRVLNALRARGAFAEKPAAAAEALVRKSVWSWLFPANGLRAPGYAAAAVLAIAVVTVPFMLRTGGPGDGAEKHATVPPSPIASNTSTPPTEASPSKPAPSADQRNDVKTAAMGDAKALASAPKKILPDNADSRPEPPKSVAVAVLDQPDIVVRSIPKPTSAQVRSLDLLFAPTKATLSAPELNKLQAIGRQWRGVLDHQVILVEAAPDENGTDASRLALANKRAEFIKLQLLLVGVPTDKVEISSSAEPTWVQPAACKGKAVSASTNPECINPGSIATVTLR